MSAARRRVCTAIMPQPMSTPTAAGITAPVVGMTVPTAEPFPKCASGMRAMCGCTNGNRAVSAAWVRVLSSTCDA